MKRYPCRFRDLTNPDTPEQTAEAAWVDHILTVRTEKGRVLFEFIRQFDDAKSVSKVFETGVALSARTAFMGNAMVALTFEEQEVADELLSWFQGHVGVPAVSSKSQVRRNFVTTALEIPGCRILSSLGIVSGINVRAAGPWGNLTAGVQSAFGGTLSSFVELSRDAREKAYSLMIGEAETLGANAVIGVRFDANDVVQGATEIMCYGTAVVVQGIAEADQESPASTQ